MNCNKESFQKQIQKTCTPLPGSIAYPTTYKLPVKKKYEGRTIIDFFLEVVPRSSKELWLSKIRNKTLLINGKPANENTIVKGGDITQHTSEPKIEPDVSIKIDLLYNDDKLLIVNKPAPLPMHPSGRFNKNSLTEILKLAFPEEDFKIIHRLDANTTGIVVFGKNKEIATAIGTQFEQKLTTKKYIALVEGIVEKEEFAMNSKIGTKKTIGGGRASDQNGQEAYTEFKVLERRQNTKQTLLEVTPHTGRTNQIRLHLAQLKHAIVGDWGYKDPNYFKNHPLTYPTDSLYLHAWQLEFKYQNQNLKIQTAIPTKFEIQ
ncbi:RluA family pseudouridine synthase [Ochrovirga pacifica]|uniref:RluA family pseudouridine synthase n=1 Tax=Ochrovirga pacifica TaxID=1042376 RepID=UPI0002557C0D|nr:RluA family pseudouridine synthase [Ochrovirga pacifica]